MLSLRRCFILLVCLSTTLGACVDSRLRDGVAIKTPGAHSPESSDGVEEDANSVVFTPPAATDSTVLLFQRDDVVRVTISGDFPRVNVKGAPTDRRSKGELIFDEGKSLEVELFAVVDPTRSTRCDRLPLGLHLPNVREGSVLQNLHSNDLLLITQCRGKGSLSARNAEAQRVLGEYALHRMLAATGLPHYRTRLAQVRLLDLRGRIASESYGIFREPTEDLAVRYGLTVPADKAEGDELMKRLDARYRITSEVVAHLARLADGYEPRILAGPGRGVTLTLPSLGTSLLLDQAICGPDCFTDEKDGAFFENLLIPRVSSKAKWRLTVLRELRRISITREEVVKAVRRVSALSSKVYRVRVENFFDALEIFLAKNPEE